MDKADKRGMYSVSVVIPCFRCAATIRRAVRSVVLQSAKPMEIILVDDCSKDETLEVLRAQQSEYDADWIRVIALERNVGAAGARNAGWETSTADYIAFLDADDVWHARKLEIQLRFLREHPEVDLCAHSSRTLSAPEDIDETRVLSTEWNLVTSNQLVFSNRFITPSVIVRRNVPKRFRSDQRYMEDHLLWVELAFSGCKLAKLQAELAWTFKPAYGKAGLSAALWRMECAELGNHRLLWEKGNIGFFTAAFLFAFSLMKFGRRFLIVGIRWLFG